MFFAIDGKLGELTNSLSILREAQVIEATNSYNLYDSVETKVDHIASTIGTKPPSFSEEFNAPDIWLSLASIANRVKHSTFTSSK